MKKDLSVKALRNHNYRNGFDNGVTIVQNTADTRTRKLRSRPRFARAVLGSSAVLALTLAVLPEALVAPAPARADTSTASPTPYSGPASGGTTVTGTVPVPSAPAIRFTAVAGSSGVGSAYGLTSTGSIYAWGDNSHSELGNGTTINSSVPVAVSTSGVSAAALPFTAIAAGANTAYALGANGNIYAWGDNSSGQLGNGTTGNGTTGQDSAVPVHVQTTGLPTGALPFKAIAAGTSAGFALGADGNIYTWGNGAPVNTTSYPLSPIPLATSGIAAGTLPFTAIAAQGGTVYALGSNGTVEAWGLNSFGQLGIGTVGSTPGAVEFSNNPVQLVTSGLSNAAVPLTAIAAGRYAGYALGSNGVVYAWGHGTSGQLGNGSSTDSALPVPVTTSGLAGGTLPFKSAAATPNNGYALGSNGVVYAWGQGSSGELGNGTQSSSTVPVQLATSGLPGTALPFTSLSAGSSANGGRGYAIGSDGNIYAWGNNTAGALGNGSLNNSSAPVQVVNPASGTTTTVQLTSVLYGSTPASNVTTLNPTTGAWSAVTPAGAGPVPVTVNYTVNGVAQSLSYPAPVYPANASLAAQQGFTFGAPPAITTQPAASYSNGTFSTSVAVTGDPAPSLQWQVSTGSGWTNVSGAQSSNLSVPNATPGAQYRVVASNSWGSAYSVTSAMVSVPVVSVPVAGTGTLTIDSTTGVVANGTTQHAVTATLTSASGAPESGVTVTFSVTSGAVLSTATAVTNAQGVATTRVSSQTVGSYLVSASATDSIGAVSFSPASVVAVFTQTPPSIVMSRIQGPDRYSTAVAAAKQQYPNGASTVILARGTNYPDAISAAPAAVKLNAPILLTQPDTLTGVTLAELNTLHPSRVIVLGDTVSVSAATLKQVQTQVSSKPNVVRLAGIDRYATNRALVSYVWGSRAATAIVATGQNFTDAESASSAAAKLAAPLILVNGNASALDSASSALLKTLHSTTIHVVGSETNLSAAVYSGLGSIASTIDRTSGTDPSSTSIAVAQVFFPSSTQVYIATSDDFPDALIAGAIAGKVGAPVLFTVDSLSPGIAAEVLKLGATQVYIMGDSTRITDAAYNSLAAALGITG